VFEVNRLLTGMPYSSFPAFVPIEIWWSYQPDFPLDS